MKQSPFSSPPVHTRCVLFVLLLAFACMAGPRTAFAQARAKADAPDKARTERDQLYAARAKAWSAFYAEKYEEAGKLIQPLTTCDRPEVRAEATHLLARCYWSAGGAKGQAEADKIWKELGKATPGRGLNARLSIGKALALQDKGKTPQAIELLEDVMRRDVGGTATVEAALELTQLYIKNQQLDNAKKALDYCQAFLAKDRLVKLEISEIDAAPFVQAVQDAKAHLKYDVNAGLAEWEEAEKLRAAKKYPQAIAAYQKIITAYPESDFAPRSGLTIGYCLVDARQIPQATQHWTKFVTAAPSGPWRGQAFVGLSDLSLEEALDLAAAGKHAEIAANAMTAAWADEKAIDSWTRAAYDIHLRLGIVRMAQGKPAAADHFQQAAATEGLSAEVQEGLAALIAAAQSGKPVLPDDAATAGDKPDAPAAKTATALTIGTIHNVAGRFDRAEIFFDRILKGQLRGSTPAQVGYAAFGKAAALQGQQKVSPAKDNYLASIKGFAAGSWHDETLYRIARIIQADADAKHPAPPTAPPANPPKAVGAAGAKPSDKIKPLTAAELEQRESADRARRILLVKAKSESLPYWDELIKKYPASPRAWTAYFNAGVLLSEMEQWNQAADIFNQFVTDYPKHPLAGEAYVKLIDMALEESFSLADAEKAGDAGVKWTDVHAAGDQEPDKDEVTPWRVTTFRDPQPDAKTAAYKIYLRAGLVAYLNNKTAQATESFRKGRDFDETDRKQSGAETGLDRMTAIAEGKTKSLTPDDLLPLLKDDRQKTGVALADLYLMTFNPEKAGGLYKRLLTADAPFPKPQPGVEAYLLLRLGQSLEFQKRHDEAMVYMKRLYDPQYAKFPWTADGIFRVGTWVHNATQDPKDAMGHWKHVFTNTPDHPEAERSLFFYALSAGRMKDYASAVAAYREYLKRYPQGRWAKRIEDELLPAALQNKNNPQPSQKEKK